MLKINKYFKNESGQAMVMVVIAMSALLVFGGFAIDVGSMAHQKGQMQNAADSIALAAAQDLPTSTAAQQDAIKQQYAVDNGVDLSEVNIITPYEGDNNKVLVECTRNYQHSFFKVLGLNETAVTVRAVAEHYPYIPAVPPVPPTPDTPGVPGWDGGTVPFINYSHYTKGQEILIWNKVGAGNFTCLLHAAHDPYYRFDLDVGATHANGKINNIKFELEPILQPNATVYLISLSNKTISGVTVPTTKGSKTGSFKLPDGNAGQGETVATQYLVLFKCTVLSYDTGKTIKFRIEEIYDLGNSDTGDIDIIHGSPPTEDVPGIPGTPGTPGTPEVPESVKLIPYNNYG